jgi:putative cell wall-binding protein
MLSGALSVGASEFVFGEEDILLEDSQNVAPLDTQELEGAIAYAQSKSPASYSMDIWNALQLKIEDAIYLLSDDFATQTDLDKMTLELTRLADRILGSFKPYVGRISGNSRVDTSIQISNSWKNSTHTAVLANGLSLVDALSGGPLAHKLNAPILLTLNGPDGLESSVIEQFKYLKIDHVILLGGEGSISAKIRRQIANLKDITVSAERVGGDNRYDTAVQIAKKIDLLDIAEGNTDEPSYYFLADGVSSVDALCITPVAAKKNGRILLATKNVLPEVTATYLNEKQKDIDLTIVGGAIGDSVLEQAVNYSCVQSFKRISGGSRYDTAINIYKEYELEFKSHILTLTNGANYTDALAGGVLAAKLDAPMLLVHCINFYPDVTETIKSTAAKSIYVLGGKANLPDRVVDIYIDAD